MFALVEYKTFLITSLASCKYSLLRARLNLTESGEPGSILSVDVDDTSDWLTANNDSEVLLLLLNLTVKATNHRKTESLALVIDILDSLFLGLLQGTCAAKQKTKK